MIKYYFKFRSRFESNFDTVLHLIAELSNGMKQGPCTSKNRVGLISNIFFHTAVRLNRGENTLVLISN